MGDSLELIPVIDFSVYSLSRDRPDLTNTDFRTLVDNINKALRTIGFFYVINTGFPQEKVQQMWKASKEFFHLPASVKDKYPGIPMKITDMCEWNEKNRPHGDLKEVFNYHPMTADENNWPTDSECPGFKQVLTDFWDPCLVLHDRILEVMGHALQLQDPLIFVKHHSKAFEHSGTTLRTLYYPALADVSPKEQQVRCGEHSDYGGITLLFQERPGLEVRNRGGSYIKAQLVENGVLVNIGDLMQRWTADKFLAVKHRVLLEDAPGDCVKPRQSIAFFGHPNYDSLIECVDGSNKYPPINSLDYINMRFGVTY